MEKQNILNNMDYEILNLCGSCGDGGACTDAPAEAEGAEEVKEEETPAEGEAEGGEEEAKEEEPAA